MRVDNTGQFRYDQILPYFFADLEGRAFEPFRSDLFLAGRICCMLIKCWGSRGSIPVSGKDYIKYGGDTTCIEIRGCDGRVIIIDAGTGIRSLGNVLQRESCRTVDLFFTHVHWDHIFGFPFSGPFTLQISRYGSTVHIQSTLKRFWNTRWLRRSFR